jgi:hypothetical protein
MRHRKRYPETPLAVSHDVWDRRRASSGSKRNSGPGIPRLSRTVTNYSASYVIPDLVRFERFTALSFCVWRVGIVSFVQGPTVIRLDEWPVLRRHFHFGGILFDVWDRSSNVVGVVLEDVPSRPAPDRVAGRFGTMTAKCVTGAVL